MQWLIEFVSTSYPIFCCITDSESSIHSASNLDALKLADSVSAYSLGLGIVLFGKININDSRHENRNPSTDSLNFALQCAAGLQWVEAMHSLRSTSQRSHSLQLGSEIHPSGFSRCLASPCWCQVTNAPWHHWICCDLCWPRRIYDQARYFFRNINFDKALLEFFYWNLSTWFRNGRFSKGSGVSQTLPTLCALPQCFWHAGKKISKPFGARLLVSV